jgi:hypothetical protein
MFALIIAIIAIALTVYLAVSTLFYGGDALSNGSARAVASAFINQGQQINGAHTLYKNDNAGSSLALATTDALAKVELELLVSQKYLSSIPKPDKSVYTIEGLATTQTGGATAIAKALVAKGSIPNEVCSIINQQAGGSASGVTPVVQGQSETFGCFGTTPATNTVWYRM